MEQERERIFETVNRKAQLTKFVDSWHCVAKKGNTWLAIGVELLVEQETRETSLFLHN